jgi:dCMP deaminase
MIRQSDKWDRRFLDLAKHVAQWSKDPSTKVGAVLISTDGKEFVGYNGFPIGVLDSDDRLNNREVKYKLVVHAEVNAILKAGDKARGGTLYVWPSFSLPPICHECCKMAIQAGVKEIVGYLPDENDERVQRWKASISVSEEMCKEAGITYRGIPENK